MVGWRSFINFYINSSLHVSLAILSFTLVTYLEYTIPFDVSLLVFIFLASITGYNFIKYAGIAKYHHYSLTRNLRQIQIFSLFVFLGLIASAFFQTFKVLGLSVLMGGITFLYALPIFNQNKNLRDIPGIKIYVITLVVTVVTLLMPLLDYKLTVSRDLLVSFLQRFCFILALILPFEIRDLKFDMAQLGTIPQRIGVTKTRFLGYMLLILTVLLEFLKDNSYLAYSLGLLSTAIITGYVIKISKINQSTYFSSFWVEAIPILWFGLVLLFQAIY